MTDRFVQYLVQELDVLRRKGLYKTEHVINSRQSAEIEISVTGKVLNFCANNYLGLADNPELIRIAKAALDRYGYGMASSRLVCGTQEEHKLLEERIAEFLDTEDAILYSSGFDANTGLFESLLDERDVIIFDELNHPSIVDGARLSKATKYRYHNNDMDHLEANLQKSRSARFRMIATDGVFSTLGVIANLREICDLADKYDAMVMVDDSHAVGFVGEHGRGTAEHCGVEGRIDIINGTLGKALGGASGGYTAASEKIVEWLRQRSRPYLFSNTLTPVIAAASIKAFELIDRGGNLRQKLNDNAAHFRAGMSTLGFELVPGEHPIIPVMLGEENIVQQLTAQLLKEAIYVIGFSFPVVPHGKARIRTQMSAAHSQSDIDRAITAFEKVGAQLKLI